MSIDSYKPETNASAPSQHSLPVAGTQRVSSFRDKLAGDDLSRYEVYVSSTTRQEIKDIAKLEGLTAGVVGEALLKLGIESYRKEAGPLKKVEAPSTALAASASAISADSSTRGLMSMASVQGALSLAGDAMRFVGQAAALKSEDPEPFHVTSEQMDAHIRSIGAVSKGLIDYTDRRDVRSSTSASSSASAEPAAPSSKTGNVMDNMINAARRRKPPESKP